MIHADRITVGGNMPYEDVYILNEEEQRQKGLTNYFEDAQIAMKCKGGFYTLPMYKINLILLKRSKKVVNSSLAQKVKRLSIAGDLTFCPAFIIRPDAYEQAGVPRIFKLLDQFSFVADEGLFITTDFNVTMIEH